MLLSGGWGRKIKLKPTTLPRVFMHVVRRFTSILFALQCQPAYAPVPVPPVATPASQAAVVYGRVSVLTQLDPWGSGAVEIATGKVILPGSMGHAQAHTLPNPRPPENIFPLDLVQLRLHPIHSGVGPRSMNRSRASEGKRAEKC